MKKFYPSIIALVFIPFALNAQQGEDISIGKVFTLDSKVFKEKREYRVLLPRSYSKGVQKYPVLYVLDGDSYYLSAYSAMRALSGNGAMPEAIVVAITTPEREKNMTPPYMNIPFVQSPNADVFLSHLSEELIPHINKSYRTLPLRVLMGHSHGGIFNIYALTERPDAFKWHLIVDVPMHLDNFILEKQVDDFIKANPAHKARIATSFSSFEWRSHAWENLKRMDNGITAINFEVHDENHSSMYYQAFYFGLKRLFSDYAYKHDATRSFRELDQRYRTMSAEYGYDVKIPQSALGNGSLEHLAAGNLEEARAFVGRLKSEYNTQKVFREDVGEWLNDLENKPPKETRETYLNLPDAKPSQVTVFLGLWKSGSNYELDIKVKDGLVEALFTQFMPGGHALKTQIEKFVIMEDGSLEISFGNRMTPRSMIIAYKLSPPNENQIEVSKRLIVYWPNMAGRRPDDKFTLKRMK